MIAEAWCHYYFWKLKNFTNIKFKKYVRLFELADAYSSPKQSGPFIARSMSEFSFSKHLRHFLFWAYFASQTFKIWYTFSETSKTQLKSRLKWSKTSVWWVPRSSRGFRLRSGLHESLVGLGSSSLFIMPHCHAMISKTLLRYATQQ